MVFSMLNVQCVFSMLFSSEENFYTQRQVLFKVWVNWAIFLGPHDVEGAQIWRAVFVKLIF